MCARARCRRCASQRFWMRNAIRNTKVIVAEEVMLPSR
jgi:hypothetical protein